MTLKVPMPNIVSAMREKPTIKRRTKLPLFSIAFLPSSECNNTSL